MRPGSVRDAIARMRAVKARAERMVANVLGGALHVPAELRCLYLDAVWRGVREAQWPGVTAREAKLLDEAASIALNLHEIAEKFRAEASRESAPGIEHHAFPKTGNVVGIEAFFHRAWSSCVGRPKYDKSKWTALHADAVRADKSADAPFVDDVRARIVTLHDEQEGGPLW